MTTEFTTDDLKWSEWVEGVSSTETNGGWFKRLDQNLPTTVLPTKQSGVYEIAYKDKRTKRIKRVYVGKSKNLRQRIYSGYCLNGSHIADYLSDLIKQQESSIYFRWALVPEEFTKSVEDDLLDDFNYPLNATKNAERDKGRKQVPDERAEQIDELINNLKVLQLTPREIKEVIDIVSQWDEQHPVKSD